MELEEMIKTLEKNGYEVKKKTIPNKRMIGKAKMETVRNELCRYFTKHYYNAKLHHTFVCYQQKYMSAIRIMVKKNFGYNSASDIPNDKLEELMPIMINYGKEYINNHVPIWEMEEKCVTYNHFIIPHIPYQDHYISDTIKDMKLMEKIIRAGLK